MFAQPEVKYALHPLLGTTVSHLTFSPIVGSMSVVNRAPSRGGAFEKMTMSCCLCEPMETAQYIGDDTHAVVTRIKGHQSTDFAAVLRGPLCRWVSSLAHRQVLTQGRGQRSA